MSNTSTRDTRPISVAQARDYARQAHEYLRAAEESLSLGMFNAAAGNGITTVINAADAVSGRRLLTRWVGPHEGAAKHVEQAGPDGKALARELRKVMPYKNKAQYDPTPIRKDVATAVVHAAQRGCAIALRVCELESTN